MYGLNNTEIYGLSNTEAHGVYNTEAHGVYNTEIYGRKKAWLIQVLLLLQTAAPFPLH